MVVEKEAVAKRGKPSSAAPVTVTVIVTDGAVVTGARAQDDAAGTAFPAMVGGAMTSAAESAGCGATPIAPSTTAAAASVGASAVGSWASDG